MSDPRASASASSSRSRPAPSSSLVQVSQPLDEFLESFWTSKVEIAEEEEPDFKHHALPLARIKKVMKQDDDCQMISAEAPIILSRACELFIAELTCRSFLVAEGKKRKTLQRADVGRAVQGSDVFDFLVDLDVGRLGKGNGFGKQIEAQMQEEGGEHPAESSRPKKKSRRKSEVDSDAD